MTADYDVIGWADTQSYISAVGILTRNIADEVKQLNLTSKIRRPLCSESFWMNGLELWRQTVKNK